MNGVYELICLLVGHDLDEKTFAAIYERQLEDPNHYCLVDDRDGVLYGVMNMRFEEQLHHGGTTAEIIEFLFVKKPVVKAQVEKCWKSARNWPVSEGVSSSK